MAIKLYIENLNGMMNNYNRYVKYRINSNRKDKLGEIFREIKWFFIDAVMMVFGWINKKKKRGRD